MLDALHFKKFAKSFLFAPGSSRGSFSALIKMHFWNEMAEQKACFSLRTKEVCLALKLTLQNY